MTEQFVNMAQSELVLDMDDLGSTVIFDVVGAEPFATLGNFRVLIDSELFLVTSVTTNTFTADRAQEGTEAAAHTAGAQVTHILTAQSLANIVGEAQSLFTEGLGSFSGAVPATIPIVVTGSRADPEGALAQLLTWLANAGLIDNQTTA